MNRTEALRLALNQVYSGAERIDAECVADALDDLGFEVRERPAVIPGQTSLLDAP